MTAEGHVVGMEWLFAVDVVVHGGLNHLKIRGRPVDLHVQAGIRCLKVVAHVGVGDVAVVEIANVVVIAVGLVAHSVQRVAEAEGKIVGARHIEARIRLGAGHIRVETHAHGVFAIGGDGLERAVVVFKNDARVGHFIEGGRQLLADEPRAKALGADGDEVIVLQKPCVVALAAGRYLGEVFVRCLENGAVGAARQLCEVDALDHVEGVAAIRLLIAADFQSGGRKKGDVAVIAGNHIVKLLHGGGDHADLFITAVGGGVYIGEGLIDGKGLVASDEQEPYRHQNQYEQQRKGRLRLLPAQTELQRRDLSQCKACNHCDQRQQQQNDARQVFENRVEELRVEVCDHVLAHADLADGNEVAEDALIDQLYLGKQHLHRYKKHANGLAKDLGQE